MDHLHNDWRARMAKQIRANLDANYLERCKEPLGWPAGIANMGEAPEYTTDLARSIEEARNYQQGVAPPFVNHDGYVPQWQFTDKPEVPTLTDAITLPCAVTGESINVIVGRAFVLRVRRRQQWAGTFVVAKQLRKQGWGLGFARLLLLGRL